MKFYNLQCKQHKIGGDAMKIQGSLYYAGKKLFFGEGETALADGLISDISCQRFGENAVYALLHLKNKGAENLVLAGVVRRGRYLAERISRQIENVEGVKVPCLALNTAASARDEQLEITEIS